MDKMAMSTIECRGEIPLSFTFLKSLVSDQIRIHSVFLISDPQRITMRKAREKRAMMIRTMSEACLAAGSQAKKPANPKKWYRSLSFVVGKKPVGNLENADKTECESSDSASSDQSNHSPTANVPTTTSTKTRDCSACRSSNSRAENQQCSRKPETQVYMTPKTKKASFSSIQPRRSISHREICVSPKSRTLPQRAISSSLDCSKKDSVVRSPMYIPTTLYSPSTSRQDQESASISQLDDASDFSESGSIGMSVSQFSPKKSPTKQRALLTPKRSIRSLLSNGKKMNPLQEIPLSPRLWDAADFCQMNQDPEMCLTPQNKNDSRSSMQPRRPISHREICISPVTKSRTKPQRTRSSSLQHDDSARDINLAPRLSLGFSEKGSAAKKTVYTQKTHYSPTMSGQDQKSAMRSLPSPNPSPKKSPTKQRALTPKRSIRSHFCNGKMMDPLQEILLSPSLWDAADYCQPCPAGTSSTKSTSMPKPKLNIYPPENGNAMDPEMCSAPKYKKGSLSSIHLRRSMSHREICFSPATKSRAPPQRKRSSSLDFSNKDSVERKAVYNPATLYSPTKSREGQESTMRSFSSPNPSPSVRILVEASDFSESGTVALSVYDSSIYVSQFSPEKSPAKQSAATPKRSIRSLFSNGNKMNPLQEIPVSPSLWDAADFCQPSPAGTSSTKCPSTPTSVVFSALSCPRSPSSSTELMALAVTDGIRRATKIQKMQEKRLNERILNHMSFAEGRLSNGNTVGAILSMKKAKRVELERDRVRAAIACLEKHLSELNSGTQSVRARTIAALPFCSIECEDEDATKSNPCSKGVINIAAHKQYAFEVEQILSASDEKVIFPDDEALLEELRIFWLEERADKCLEELRKLSPLRSNCKDPSHVESMLFM